MTPGARSLLLAVAIAAALVGAKVWKDHLIAKGDAQGAARVQAAWDTQELLRSQVTAGANTLRQRNAEKVANEKNHGRLGSRMLGLWRTHPARPPLGRAGLGAMRGMRPSP